jgi:hypothetical protein
VRACKQTLSEQLQVPKSLLSVWPKFDNALAVHFSTSLLESYPEALSLDHEIAACVKNFIGAQEFLPHTQAQGSGHALLVQYRAQRELAQSSLKEWVDENTQLLIKVESVQDENKQLFNQYLDIQQKYEVLNEDTEHERKVVARLITEQKVAQEQVAQVTADNIEHSKNNEQLFFDLHQAQRALETSIERNVEIEAQLAEMSAGQAQSQELAGARLAELEQALHRYTALQNKKNEVEAENEILLSQFQQALIDLESHILKNRAQQEAITAEQTAAKFLDARLSEVTAEYESLSQAHVQWCAEREALIEQIKLKDEALLLQSDNSERVATAHQEQVAVLQDKQNELAAENETLLSQVQQSLVDLNSYSLENQTLQDTIAAKNEDLAAVDERVLAVTAEYEVISAAHIQWVAEREQLTTQVDLNQKSLSDLRSAHEALLLELASAQKLAEEQCGQNEHSALILERLKDENRNVNSRLSRILQKIPVPVVFDRLEALGPPSGDQLKTKWQVVGLDTGKRFIPSVLFSTILEDTALGFCFSRPEASASGLVRWPSILVTSTDMVLSPVGDATTGPIRAETWLSLSTSDLEIVTALVVSLELELSAGRVQAQFGQSHSNQIANGLAAFRRFSNEANSPFRYDQVRLKRVTVNDDYEHLWIEFENVSYQNARFAHFEVRVACSELISKRFGSFPKLEFPRLEIQTPLGSWYAESRDEFGEKLELRFASPNLFDVEVWQKLSIDDHGFIVSLLERLPTILRELDLERASLPRPWPQWQSVVEHMARCLAQNIATPQSIATAPNTAKTQNIATSQNTATAQNAATAENEATAQEIFTTAEVLATKPLPKNASRAFVSFFQES